MDHLDMTERLVQKAGVTYEEAKAALERSGWDMLRAIIDLEQQGKVTQQNSEQAKEDSKMETNQERGEAATQAFEKAGGFITRLVEKGNRNRLEVRRSSRLLFTLPLTVLVILGILCFWLIWPGMLIAWFFGWRYSLEGPDMRSSKEYQHSSRSSTVT